MKEEKQVPQAPRAPRPSLAREQAAQHAADRTPADDRGRPLSLPIFRN